MLTRSQNKAFSITELVMVLGGLGLLATLILPLPQSLRQRDIPIEMPLMEFIKNYCRNGFKAFIRKKKGW